MVDFQIPLMKCVITHFPDNFHDWHFPDEIRSKYENFVTKDMITLVPSANWEMKRWPVSYWKELVALLPEYRFVILAGPKDTFCEEIRSAAPERVVNLAGQTSLMESSYIVLCSNLVISADTGFMHAADLFRVPAFALMGPTAFGFPTGPTVEILETALPCRPCTKDGRGKCKLAVYQKWMVDITPQLVAEKIIASLG